MTLPFCFDKNEHNWSLVEVQGEPRLASASPPWERDRTSLKLACVLLFVGMLIEKGLGTIAPGLCPSRRAASMGICLPTQPELVVSLGLWAMGRVRVHLVVQGGNPGGTGTAARPISELPTF